MLDGARDREYIYLNGERLLRIQQPGGGIRYHWSDHLGTPRVVTNNAGDVICQHDYYPYGGERTSCSDDESRKFTLRLRSGQAGQERDAETGLDYFVARHYASNLGRFLRIQTVEPETNPGPIGIITNFFDELRRLVPAKQD